ncbi:hypothetical protein NDN08_008226 [Rhodosorus marinus]|uniref:EamA domain-containing protein n=1 Tax=Rhodosorus marinus TaxID=101924 RepID=A0AAV8V2L6_9RHOD|nr:hypothetical protein NDN08_008226 [Rhodosorus marinus]
MVDAIKLHSAKLGLAILLVGKTSRVLGTFWAFRMLSNSSKSGVPVPIFLFFLLLGCAFVVIPVQQPWRGRRIGIKKLSRVLIGGCVLDASLYLWLKGLGGCGPLRTLLLDGAELPLLYLSAWWTKPEARDKVKTRAVLCMLLAYLLLLIDASGKAPNQEIVIHEFHELERFGIGQNAEKAFQSLRSGAGGQGSAAGERTGPSKRSRLADRLGEEVLANRNRMSARALLNVQTDEGPPPMSRPEIGAYHPVGTKSEIGVVFVLLCSALHQATRGFSRKLGMELGGAKRFYALTASFATVIVAPWALFEHLNGAVFYSVADVLAMMSIGFLLLVVPYYARAMMSPDLSNKFLLQANLTLPFVLAALGEFTVGAGEGMHGFTVLLLLIFALDVLGVFTAIHRSEVKRERPPSSSLPYRN